MADTEETAAVEGNITQFNTDFANRKATVSMQFDNGDNASFYMTVPADMPLDSNSIRTLLAARIKTLTDRTKKVG